ncbi:MAG: hypothetical protein U5R31_08295 [Acidimicrobiia bacterium]|nr:hypothetical protein [Acidimicrobiia bacterium]
MATDDRRLDESTDPAESATATDRRLAPGTRVEVRQRFDASWSRGFEIVESTEEGYRIRRLSDRAVLPAVFVAEDVRREKGRNRSMWWY